MQQLVLEKEDTKLKTEVKTNTETEKKLDGEIFSLALYARRRFEKINREIEEFPSSLSGSCAIASAILFKVLKDKGHKPVFCCGEDCVSGHCWIEVNDFVVDLTATQFRNCGYKKVNIIPKDKLHEHESYTSWNQLVRYEFVPVKLSWQHQNPHSKLAKDIYRRFFIGLDMTCTRNKVYIKNMTC